MDKDVGGLNDLSTKKAAVAKVKARQNVNFKSWVILLKQVCQFNPS